MLQEKSCGAVVLRHNRPSFEILLIKHAKNGHWSFPKGHMEGNEMEKETALREIKEETGLTVTFYDGFREQVSYSPKSGVYKEVIYFLSKALNDNVVIQQEEVSDFIWVNLEDASAMLTFHNDRRIISNVITFLTQQKQ